MQNRLIGWSVGEGRSTTFILSWVQVDTHTSFDPSNGCLLLIESISYEVVADGDDNTKRSRNHHVQSKSCDGVFRRDEVNSK